MSFVKLAALFVLCAVLASSAPLEGGIPPALKNLTADQKSQLEKILTNPASTKGQIKTQIGDWVKTQGSDIQAAYATITSKIEDRKTQIAQKQNSLSDAAKTVAADAQKAMEDESLTLQQTCEKINTLVTGATPAVQTELEHHLKQRDCSNIQNAFDKFFNGKNDNSAAAPKA